jgi:hypothetical protein
MEDLPSLRVPENRRLMATIIRDARFDSLDWQTLKYMVKAVNTFSNKPVIEPKELEAARHPYSESHFIAEWLDRATYEYPKETEDLLQHLKGWRTALRESISTWEKPRQHK